MMMILYLLISLLFLCFYYLVGHSVKYVLNLHLQGFEFLLGFLTVFSLFHTLAVFPTIMHMSIGVIYWILGLIVAITSLLMIYTLRKWPVRIQVSWFVTIVSLIFMATYYLFDFIIPDDASFYLPLIRSVSSEEGLYTLNPWTGITDEFIGYMYYFVTYDVYIGSLAALLRIDSTIFTVTIVPFINLVIILSSWYAFFQYLFNSKKKASTAFILYLLIFIFLNTNSHAIPFTHNAFNFMTNSFTGKALYFYSVVPLLFVLFNTFARKQTRKTLLLIGLLNLMLPGLNASIIYLQLMMTTSLLVYLLWFNIRSELSFYGGYLLVTFTPIMLNYLFLLFAPEFPFRNSLVTSGLLLIFLIMIAFGLGLYRADGKTFHWNPNRLKRILLIIAILSPVLSIISLVFYLVLADGHMAIKGLLQSLPSFSTIMFLYGFDLIVFYVLGFRSFLLIRKQNHSKLHFIMNHYLIIMVILFINPITIPFVASFITSIKTYHRVVYILPVSFMIVYYLIHISKKQLAIWFLLILVPGVTIFHDSKVISKETNFYYKIDQDVIDVGTSFNSLDKRYRIIGDDRFVRELPSVTTNYEHVIPINKLRMMKYDLFNDDQLLDLYSMIHNKLALEETYFKHLIKQYKVELIIVYTDNELNEFLLANYKYDDHLSSEVINVYRVK